MGLGVPVVVDWCLVLSRGWVWVSQWLLIGVWWCLGCGFRCVGGC